MMGSPRLLARVDVLAEHLILHLVVGRRGQVVQPHLGDADDAGVVPGQPFQPGVHIVVHRVVGLHGVDANAGVEHRMFVSQGDAPLGGFYGGAGQQDVAHAGRVGAFQDARYFLGNVLVQVGMGVAIDGRCGHPESLR